MWLIGVDSICTKPCLTAFVVWSALQQVLESFTPKASNRLQCLGELLQLEIFAVTVTRKGFLPNLVRRERTFVLAC
jgi:hypothetical protein